MMTKNQNANYIIMDTEEKIIGESVEIHSPETTFSYTMSFWIVSCGLNKKQSSE